jgi:hypothetical protein
MWVGDLGEAFKNQVGHILTDAAAGVGDFHKQEIVVFFGDAGLNLHNAFCGGELNGVIDEDNKDLPDAGGIGSQEWQVIRKIGGESDFLECGGSLESIHGVDDGVGGGGTLWLDEELAKP